MRSRRVILSTSTIEAPLTSASCPLPKPPQHVHLPQAILRHRVAFEKVDILRVLRLNMRNAQRVACNRGRPPRGSRQFPRNYRQ